jgi:hypothetical protein
MTQAQRSDEPATHLHTIQHKVLGFPNVDHKCNAQTPGQGAAYCLTRMMDCRKPSGAFKDNVQAKYMVQARRLVQTCLADGCTWPPLQPRTDGQCAFLTLWPRCGGQIRASMCSVAAAIAIAEPEALEDVGDATKVLAACGARGRVRIVGETAHLAHSLDGRQS